MIKVVVVDDEPYLLRNIKESIQQANENFIVVGEAFDGEEALLVIEKTCPDIIFTDIRMPVIDGLELIEKLRIIKIKALPVILSGYQEFDYAKKAIKLGVADYLLKPINPESLAKLLNELYIEVTQAKRNQQLNVFDLVINNNLNSEEIKIDINKPFMEYKDFHIIFVCSGPYCTYTFSQFTPSRDFWFKANPENILQKIIKKEEDFWVIDGELSNEKIIILGSTLTQNRFSEIALSVHYELCSFNYPITTIHSDVSNGIQDLPLLIRNLKAFMRKKNIFGESSFNKYIHDIGADHSSIDLDDLLHDKILTLFIENEQISQFKAELKKVLYICMKQKYPQFILERLLRQIFQMFSTIVYDEFNIEEKVDELISNAANYSDIYESTCFVIDELFMAKKPLGGYENDIRAVIDKIERYINNNFTKQLSLQAIAHMFGLTQSNMSSFYKKYKGISPIEYIIELKIEKAKELLLIQPPINIKDISDSIGYDDQYYFSRIFKTITGINPSKFREACSKTTDS